MARYSKKEKLPSHESSESPPVRLHELGVQDLSEQHSNDDSSRPASFNEGGINTDQTSMDFNDKKGTQKTPSVDHVLPPKIIRTRRGGGQVSVTEETSIIPDDELASLQLPKRKRRNSAVPVAATTNKQQAESPEKKIKIEPPLDTVPQEVEIKTEEGYNEGDEGGEFDQKERLESEFSGLKQLVLEEEIAAIEKEIVSIENGNSNRILYFNS